MQQILLFTFQVLVSQYERIGVYLINKHILWKQHFKMLTNGTENISNCVLFVELVAHLNI